jgi:hypothetical protein
LNSTLVCTNVALYPCCVEVSGAQFCVVVSCLEPKRICGLRALMVIVPAGLPEAFPQFVQYNGGNNRVM